MKLNNTLAKALYDNKAECPDELAFRRGDILTVLEQNLLGSEGWWKCSLHGKQGVAPANRLQLLTSSQTSCTHHDFQGLSTNPQTIYQVPPAHKSPAPSSVYEKMDGWIKPTTYSSTSSPLQQEVYKVPALAAKVLSEKTHSSSNQHLFTLPKATWALESKSEIYDVPSPHHRVSLFTQGLATPPSSRKGSKLFPSTECCLEKAQQLYDIPLSTEEGRTRIRQESSLDNVYDIPPMASREPSFSIGTAHQGKHTNHYNTMPNLRKSEWIYDIPVSPEKAGLKETLHNPSPTKQVLYDIPPTRFDSGMQKIPPTNNKGKAGNLPTYRVPLVCRKLTAPEIPLYDVPSTHDIFHLHQNGNYDVPSGVLTSRIEKENYQHTLYDIPKGMPIALPQNKEGEKHDNSGDNIYVFPSQLTRDGKLDQDRLSVSSVDSRTSTISTSSNSSTESYSSTASASSTASLFSEHTKETTMELDLAIETLTKLQHSVSSSIASLMIFVSSRWRHQEHLKENIEEIHRAVDHIKVSLGDFLNFAQTIEGNAACVSDNKLQARIKKQLTILKDSFQILVETREALNICKWSLEVLVIKNPQNNLDDLDRFVMVARTIPDDIKRFVSIIIANGKLLFRKNSKEKDGKQQRIGVEHKTAKDTFERRIEDSLLRNVLDKPRENSTCAENSRADITEDCDYTHIQKPLEQGQAQPPLPTSKMESKNAELKIKDSPRTVKNNSLGKLDPAPKMALSELCRLYFGAVQKAISVFHKSLSGDQGPEVFIAQSKLIIMVGQKLVDALCQETIEKATRNEILCGSCQFCGLLKSLAVATKNAATQYPNPEAMKELQDRADGLSKYTQQFREMIE